MQGQRGSVESSPDTLEFDLRSNSRTTVMDQEIYWNSIPSHPSEAPNLPNYLLSPTDTYMSYANMDSESNASLNLWGLSGPSSTGQTQNQGNRDEATMELGRPGSPIGDGATEADNMLSLEDVDNNLNGTQTDDGQSFSFPLSSDINDVPQYIEHNARCLIFGGDASESSLFPHPYVPSSFQHEHGSSSSNSYGSSCISGDFDDRPGSSLDARRLACKRKNIEGLPGQSAASGSVNPSQASNPVVSVGNNPAINISTISSNVSGARSSGEQLNPRFNIPSRETAPDSSFGNLENARRNFRLRINPARQRDVYPPNLYQSASAARNSSFWLSNETSSHLIPFNQRVESRPAASSSNLERQVHIPAIPGFPQHVDLCPRSNPSDSRNVSSSSTVDSSEILSSTEQTARRNLSRNNHLDQSLLVPTTEMRTLVQDTVNRIFYSGRTAGTVAPISRPETNSGVPSSVGPVRLPDQNPSTRLSHNLPRSLVETIDRTLLTSSGSESQGQGTHFLAQRSGQTVTSQHAGHQSGSVSRGNQRPQTRSEFLMDRHNDDVPLPLRSVASREGRNRLMLEIRNALDLMRRGENLRFEDLFTLDHPVFRGVADLHDRHRELRLDVDNMSYEELLALEERIGNVSTGLGEEMILKCLKQRKYSLVKVAATADTEPCCICQEEYAEGEDLGTLDCGHDFHAVCVKQWLTHKNLCPICKTTALVMT